ncbi:MAG: DUF2190 family protein [Deltaproteobacteria bacterium]|nr:DUF2190 family protein [Deltaproteobacteria bacterium]
MAIEERVYDRSFDAAADLSEKQYYFVKLSAAHTCNVAGAADSALIGILQNKPESDRAASVRRVGVSKLVLGGTVTVGAKLTSDANGKGVTATSGQRYGAIALEAGDSGDTISALMEFGKV